MTTEILLPHEKLLAYQLAIRLLEQIQQMKVMDARLRDQLLRASKSVCLNIAEGVGRFSDADKKRVYAIARGECCEAAAAIDIARVAGECDPEQGRTAREIRGPGLRSPDRADPPVRFRDHRAQNESPARGRARARNRAGTRARAPARNRARTRARARARNRAGTQARAPARQPAR